MMDRRRGFRSDDDRLRFALRNRSEDEREFFAAAWLDWMGSEPSEERIDADVTAYRKGGHLPAYVRHFLRRWLSRNPNLRRRKSDRHWRQARLLLAGAIAAFAVVAWMIVSQRT